MKLSLIIVAFITAISLLFTIKANAQKDSADLTIILLRHAEKSKNGGSDPELSEAGKARAERLASVFPGVVPDAFYSTNYIRTKSTLAPWASQAGKEILIYNPDKQQEFADALLRQKGTIVVAGHSNTIPALINLLVREITYKLIPDEEFGKLFIVSVTDGKTNVKELDY